MPPIVEIKTHKDRVTVLEQYRILTDFLNKINDVRENANNWWTSINVGLIGLISYFRNIHDIETKHKTIFLWSIVVLGFILCYAWLSSIKTIKKRIDTNNRVLLEIEKYLPAKIFTTVYREHERTGVALTYKEGSVPLLFITGYAFFAYILLFYPEIAEVIP